MSTRWRRSYGEECGGAMDCRIEVDAPVQEIWLRCAPDTPGCEPLLRCATHAIGLVPEELTSPVDRPPATPSTPAAAVARPMVPLRKVNVANLPFDHKAAAAGKDED